MQSVIRRQKRAEQIQKWADLRKALLIVGALLMVVALPVLITGYGRLGTMTTCENFGPCPSGVSPTDSGIALLTDAARIQVIYGVLFTVVAGLLLIFGAFGSRDSVLKDRSGLR